jgi:hypothetical protein
MESEDPAEVQCRERLGGLLKYYAPGRMSREPEDAVHIGGFWIFGFLSVVLAVLKLTAYWSWWR